VAKATLIAQIIDDDGNPGHGRSIGRLYLIRERPQHCRGDGQHGE
jgi:hypothetical protein